MTTSNATTTHRQLQKRYAIGALSLAAVLGIGCVLAGWPSIGKGLALGTIFSALNFFLLGEGVILKFATGGGSSLKPLLIMIGRYATLAMPIVIAIKQPSFNLPATVTGVFMVQVCIILDALRAALKDRRDTQRQII